MDMWIERIIPPDSEFSPHCSKALGVHERALFYSTDLKSDADLLLDLEDESKDDPIKLITEIYKDSGELLSKRILGITESYISKRFKKRSVDLANHDRDLATLGRSREILLRRFKRLCGDILKRNKDDLVKSHKHYENEWNSLHDMCELIMDEISFLEKRIHDLEGVRKVERGFFWAITAFIVATFFSIANLTKDWWQPLLGYGIKGNSASIEQTPRDHVDQSSKINASVEVNFKGDTLPAELKDIARAIPDLTKAIDAHTKAISGDAPNSLATKLNELNQSASKINSAIDASKSPLTAGDIATLQTRLDEISKALGAISPAIANQKAPVVNLTPRIEVREPNQPITVPEKKSIGLLNIDASSVGTAEGQKPEQPKKDGPRLSPPHR